MTAMETEILWTAGFFNERFPAPVSPLAWSLLGPLIEEIALRDPLRYLGYPQVEMIPLTRLWRGHPYSNVLAFQVFYKVFPSFLLPEDAFRYFPDGDTSFRQRAPYPRSIVSPRFLISIFRAFLSDWQNFSPFHNYRQWARYVPIHDARVAALCARMNEVSQPSEIFAALTEAERGHRDLLRIHRWSLMHADLTFGILKRLIRAWVDREHADDIAARLIANVPNKTMEMDRELREISNLESPNLPAFLSQHGHRSFSLDIAAPTFADDPSQITRLLGQTIDHRPPTAAPISNDWSLAIGGLRSVVLKAVLHLAREYVALRENQRYYWQKMLAVSRHLYLKLADHLLADGVISQREQIFFATHRELADYFDTHKTDLAQTIADRHTEWTVYQQEFQASPTDSYPAFLRGDVPWSPHAVPVPAHSERSALVSGTQSKVARPLDSAGDSRAAVGGQPSVVRAAWQGRAVSPGRARGAARVVQSPIELTRVQPGEILIAPSTDPGWTPVFAKIAGLVLERGGVLSHGAVVAREYHIPAVAGIAHIVQEIRDGEIIVVDGSAGTVTRG